MDSLLEQVPQLALLSKCAVVFAILVALLGVWLYWGCGMDCFTGGQMAAEHQPVKDILEKNINLSMKIVRLYDDPYHTYLIFSLCVHVLGVRFTGAAGYWVWAVRPSLSECRPQTRLLLRQFRVLVRDSPYFLSEFVQKDLEVRRLQSSEPRADDGM